LAEEQGRLRHNQVGLEFISNVDASRTIIRIDANVEVWKRKIAVRYVGRVACLIVPCLEVHGLAGPNAQQDSQGLQIGYFLGERWVQAGAALFDESKVESGSAGNRLQVVGDSAVRVQFEIMIV
jgi:hypothetical protein